MSMARRVLLVNPWIYDFAAYNLWCYPLGLLYVGALLRQEGYQIHLLDCLDRRHPALQRLPRPPRDDLFGCGQFRKVILPKPPPVAHVRRRYGRYGLPVDAVEAELERLPRPHVVLVTSGMTYWYPGVVDIIQRLKARWAGVPIALGGTYATLCPDHARADSGADFVMPGSAEVDALRLVDHLTGRASSPEGDAAPPGQPLPAHDLRAPQGYVALRTSRGCPHRCAYCASHRLWPADFLQRNPQEVAAEIGWCYDALGIRDIAFYDDALLVNADDHLHPILEEVLRQGWTCRFHTPNGLHAALIDRIMARRMVRAGFTLVRLGLETASTRSNGRAGAKVGEEAFRRSVAYLREAGLHPSLIGAYILAGLPGQSLDELREAIQLAHSLRVRALLALYSPIPGTPTWQQAVDDGLIEADADPLLHNSVVFTLRTSARRRESLEEIRLYAHRGNMALCGPNPLRHCLPLTRSDPA
jgi:radical SAM superfamily enzyme YgiQ (UPF0313 family)